MRIIYLFLLFVAVLLAAACFNYAKFLAAERSMLARVSASNLKAEQKLDSLLASGIRVMETALKPLNPVKGGKLVAQYYDQNEAAMETIIAQVHGEFNHMNLLDQGIFTANMIRKPHARRFADLYPKFKKKYGRVKAAAKFLGFFARAFGKLGKLAELLG